MLQNLEKQPFWKTSVCYHISCFTLTGNTSAHCRSFSWSHSSNHHQTQLTQSKLEDAYSNKAESPRFLIYRKEDTNLWFIGKKTLISVKQSKDLDSMLLHDADLYTFSKRRRRTCSKQVPFCALVDVTIINPLLIYCNIFCVKWWRLLSMCFLPVTRTLYL